MAFPVPQAFTIESKEAARDERKRRQSPPSSFFAQSQAIYLSSRYFDDREHGYQGTVRKHMNRIRSALLAQLLAAFEFSVKDLIAQTLDATHIYDDEVRDWGWIEVDVARVLGIREGTGKLGEALVHPLGGWQTPEVLNSRYQDVFGRKIVKEAEIRPLKDMWIVRHSVAHNGGFVTEPDARRLRASALSGRSVAIDLDYLGCASELLRGIVARLESVVGPSLLQRFFRDAAARDWSDDETFYSRLKLLTTCIRSRPEDLPTVDEPMYDADLAQYG